jgi:hypothetical protein
VRGAVGQRAGQRRRDAGGDSPDSGDDGESEDLVPGRDVLQLDGDQDLQRRQRRHPHAQAGQSEAGDPAAPHVLGGLGQRAGKQTGLIGHLIRHHDSAEVAAPVPALPEPGALDG